LTDGTGRPAPPFFEKKDVEFWAKDILDKTARFEGFNTGLYLGFGSLRRLNNMASFKLAVLPTYAQFINCCRSPRCFYSTEWTVIEGPR
jgi:hypothetical protein